MDYNLNLMCDTLYFGLVVDDLTFKYLFSEIKNYLFFPLTVNYTRSRSKYYSCEAFNEDVGFFLFFSPHSNLLNDYATFQFTGKFFSDYERVFKLKELMCFLGDFIRIQRVDVSLDVLWKELPLVSDDLTNNTGFPVPSYSDNWKNVRLPFLTYGRFRDDCNYFLNMIACGKADLRLRVYDKSLDLMEKYEKSYSDYYGFEDEFLKVFRIEYQMRGKSLKEFLSNASDVGVDVKDLDEINASVMSCVFFKFDFLYLDGEAINPFYIPTSCKRKSTLDGQIEYHKNKSGFHYFRYRDLCDEKEEILKEQKQIRKIIKDDINYCGRELTSVFDFDLEKFSRNEFQDVVKDLPF